MTTNLRSPAISSETRTLWSRYVSAAPAAPAPARPPAPPNMDALLAQAREAVLAA
jgi:hypothetical protein